MTSLLVNEIFHSIQGESTHVGRPCVFIRLTGCNLRCSWCDTEYAFYEGVEMSLEDIMNRVASYGCGLVEVTGGEPLAQNGTGGLIAHLCDAGYEVLVETGGSIEISHVDHRAVIVMDLKCPGSGMEKKNLWSNIDLLKTSDEVKFVVSSETDFSWAVGVIRQYDLHTRHVVLISPAFGLVAPFDLAQWVLSSGLPIRMQMQMHKYIWEPETRGV